jgi:hypothetical protein
VPRPVRMVGHREMKYITPANGYERPARSSTSTAKPRKRLRHSPGLPPTDASTRPDPTLVEAYSNGP